MKTPTGTIAIATAALLLPAASAGSPAHAATARAATAHAGAKAAAPLAAAQPAAASAKAHHPDFNRDGYADVVVSAPYDTVAGNANAGGIYVIYGGAHGANTGNRHQYFTGASIGRGAS